MFNELELNFIKSQLLARIATVSSDLQPDVAAVSFNFDGDYFYIGGRNNLITNKYKNVKNGNSKVSLILDDIVSRVPWKVRGLKIRGTAEIIDYDGYAGPGKYLRITPTHIRNWGLE